MQICLDAEQLELNAALSVPQNAQRYYEKAKEMAKKAAGARAALAITEELVASKAEPKKTRSGQALRRRKRKWYERFRWFYSSDGFLVIGAGTQTRTRRSMPSIWRSATLRFIRMRPALLSQ